MKRSSPIVLAIALILTVPVQAWASPGTIEDLLRDDGIIVDQQPTRYGGPASDTLFINWDGQAAWEESADSLTLAQNATVARLRWYGFYGSFGQTHLPPAGAEAFRVRLYGARAADGLPGSTLFEQIFDGASRTPTGYTIYAEVMAPEYLYQVDLLEGVTLEAGTKYWLEIVQVGDIDSLFRWEYSSADDNASAFLNGKVPDWTTASGGLAFQLSTPEPESLWILVSSLSLVHLRGRRRQDRGVPPPAEGAARKYFRALGLATAMTLTLTATASASPGTIEDLLRDDGVVFDQQPTRYGGGGADTLFINAYGQPAWQQIADNLVLAETATCRRVSWHGFYGGWNQTHLPPAGAEAFRVRFYDARAGDGLPGSITFEQTFDSPSRTATGYSVYTEVMAPEYFYQVDLAQGVTLEAGAVYWLEVVQVGDVGSSFRWEDGYGSQLGHTFLNDNVPDWYYASGSEAFQLSTLPEPASLLLFVPSLFLVHLRGGRRQGRGAEPRQAGAASNYFRSVILVAAMTLTVTARAWASPGSIEDLLRDDVPVVDHQPTRYGGGGADTLFIDGYGQVTWQQSADNIMLAETATCQRLSWWGFYGASDQTHQPPSGSETFRVRLYDARAGDGLPGSTLFEQTFDSANRAPTGHTVYAEVPAPEYFYQVDLAQALTLQAGSVYWLEIVQLGDIDSHFRWEGAETDLDGLAFLNGNVPDWRSSLPALTGDLAFELWPVPEPASLLLFVPSLFLVHLRGRRRR